MSKRNCGVESCGRPSQSRGWCKMHYQRWQRHGDPERLLLNPTYGDAGCSADDCERPAFCRTWCRLHYQRWRRSVKHRDEYLSSRYGLTEAEYLSLLSEQGSCCAVCLRGNVRLVVDHCHVSGKVRRILCNDCNLALGHVRDDPAVLRALIDYLEEHRAEQPQAAPA